MQRLLARTSRSAAAAPLRSLVNVALGSRPRVVTIRTGVARGARMELDLSREKAYWLGHYEPSVQQLLAEHVGRGGVVYDVGAHVGFFTVCAGRLGASVVAFEPSAANAARVRRNADLNAIDAAVVEAAAWHEDGTVELVAGGSSSEGSVRPGAGTPARSLDSVAAAGKPPTFVKIDAEGAELHVLRGAAETIRAHRPVVVCEVHGTAGIDDLLPGYRIERVVDGSRILALP